MESRWQGGPWGASQREAIPCGLMVWALTREMLGQMGGERGSCGSLASWELLWAYAFSEDKDASCPTDVPCREWNLYHSPGAV